jgi:hypothetical protein
MSQVPFLLFPAAVALGALFIPAATLRLRLRRRSHHRATPRSARALMVGPGQDL